MDVQKIIQKMRNNPSGIRFSELKFVCSAFFGKPRQIGTSHCIYKMPWAGDPRVNIQDFNKSAELIIKNFE